MLLNCHTYYSLCYGTLSVEELMREIKEKGYDTFVLADINNTSACLDTIRTAERDFGMRPIVGVDFRNGVKQQYVAIAKNNEGFRELNIHLTRHLHAGKDFGDRAPCFDHAYVIYPFSNYKGWALQENEFVGVSVKDLQRLPFTPARRVPNKFVALQPVTFASKQHFNAHRLLRAIDKNILLSKLPVSEQTTPDEIIIPKNQLYAAYGAYHQLIDNTHRILGTCSIAFEFGKLAGKNLKHYTHSMAADMELLRSECIKGLPFRYGSTPRPEVLERLEKELEVIAQKNFASYYLINWDIVRYAQRQNYYYVGRGSGSNSLVAYLLRITDVDPIALDLYFERFINIHRNNAPDFDIDFSWTDREDVTAYIFNRFGRERTALLATYSTFRFDAVTRELGKVFGLPPAEIDRLQANPDESAADQMGKLVLRYGKLIENFPSHLSVHASGILISEEPIAAYTATFIPPKGYPTTQFSMQEAEDIGLFKFDTLSQRGLGKIKDALALVKKNRNVAVDIHDVRPFFSDDKIKALLSAGQCIGCFYVESPAMRMLLAKLRADDYLRLVAASSIIRPGVARSGMMRAYILRYRQPAEREKARAALPDLYDLLQETYGVMVYQEDVIRIAHFFAGLTLAEADHLRRGMSWKFKQRNEFWKVKQKFFTNCLEKGYGMETTTEIWTQIESFANFAFSKGHSASYAVESYQALFFKAYYPIEYMVATLNNGGGFYRPSVYIHEARMHGAKIVAPCVNNSGILCDVRGVTVYLGLGMISGFEMLFAEQIVRERVHGEFENLYDFIKRVPLPIEQLRLLIRVGAFAFIQKSKKELLWEAHSLVNQAKRTQPVQELFEVKPKQYKLPAFSDCWLDDAFDEIELLGFSLCSPFLLLKDRPDITLSARELKDHIGKAVAIVGYHVHTKVTQTILGERMCFGTFLDAAGHWIDTVHFPPSIQSYPFRGPGCYIIMGKVVEEFDFLSIEVSEMHRIPMLNPEDDRELAGQRAAC